MKKRILLALLVLFYFSSGVAQESTMKILDKAYMEALEKQCKQAIARVMPLLDSYALNNMDEIVLAHQILAYSYCEIGNQPKAIEHTKALYAFSSNADFRVFNPSPECNKILKNKSSTVPAATTSAKNKK